MPILPSPDRTSTAPARRLSPLLLAAQLLAALALALVPTAALAHDRLVSSDPADGSSVETSPQAVTLTFSDTPLSVSPVVRITGADGQTVFDGAPTILDTQATATLERPLPTGTATVDWRVVSADGHPIEGSFTFEVAQGAPTPTETSPATTVPPSASASDAASPPSDAAPTSTSTATAAASSTEGGGLSAGVIALIAVPVVMVLAVAAWFLLRRRPPHED